MAGISLLTVPDSLARTKGLRGRGRRPLAGMGQRDDPDQEADGDRGLRRRQFSVIGVLAKEGQMAPKPIIAGTDGSAESLRAVEWAVREAALRKTSIADRGGAGAAAPDERAPGRGQAGHRRGCGAQDVSACAGQRRRLRRGTGARRGARHSAPVRAASAGPRGDCCRCLDAGGRLSRCWSLCCPRPWLGQPVCRSSCRVPGRGGARGEPGLAPGDRRRRRRSGSARRPAQVCF